MHALDRLAAKPGDFTLDAWLRHALRQAFGAASATAGGQPRPRRLPLPGGSERRDAAPLQARPDRRR